MGWGGWLLIVAGESTSSSSPRGGPRPQKCILLVDFPIFADAVDLTAEGTGAACGGGRRAGGGVVRGTHLPGPAVGPRVFTSDHSGQLGLVSGEPTAESCEKREDCESGKH